MKSATLYNLSKSHMIDSELLQLAKGWSDFIFYRTIIWRLHDLYQILHHPEY